MSAQTLPPAVVDVSPYWRPVEYAEGIVVADALTWHGADAALLRLAEVPAAAVARSLLFRVAASNLAAASVLRPRVDVVDEARRYARAAEAIGL